MNSPGESEGKRVSDTHGNHTLLISAQQQVSFVRKRGGAGRCSHREAAERSKSVLAVAYDMSIFGLRIAHTEAY